MMYRMHARVTKVEKAQEYWVSQATDAEFEARFGVPGLMRFLWQQPDETLDLLVANDAPTSRRLWQEYLTWYEEGQP